MCSSWKFLLCCAPNCTRSLLCWAQRFTVGGQRLGIPVHVAARFDLPIQRAAFSIASGGTPVISAALRIGGEVKSLTKDGGECADQTPRSKANGERNRSEQQVPLLRMSGRSHSLPTTLPISYSTDGYFVRTSE